MSQVGGTRSVHFGAAVNGGHTLDGNPEGVDYNQQAVETVLVNHGSVLNLVTVLGKAQADAKLIFDKLKDVQSVSNRHGDLQVARTAVSRLAGNLNLLIQNEEGLL